MLKLTVYKDEWPRAWDVFVRSPVREILAIFPLFTLCRGVNCGEGCPKFHQPVDAEIDGVIADLWNRAWISLRGRKVEADAADTFQVYIRVPQICAAPLHWLSGQHGLYVEPRSPDGRSVDQNMAVIWMQGVGLSEAQHRQKTTDRTLPITRFGTKYGIRVMAKDEEQIRSKLGAEESAPKIQVQQIYEMRPLPHCTQRKGITQMLSEMGWAAQPIQPGRADAAGMCWKVGSEAPPPAPVVQTSVGDVAITLQKQVVSDLPMQRVLSSSKTQAHLRRQSKERGSSSSHTKSENKETVTPYHNSDPNVDPWLQADPWGKYKSPTSEDAPMQVTPKLDSMEERLRGEISTAVTQATEGRMARMEVDLAEMRNHQVKFETWCQEAGQAQQHLQAQIGQIASTVAEHSSEISDMGKEIKSGFQHLESLLVKRSRTE